MNEDWLHKVHDSMSDYEVDEPVDLWNSIEGHYGANKPDRKPVLLSGWRKYAVAVAAMLAMIVSVGMYFILTSRSTPRNQLISVVTKPAVGVPEEVRQMTEKETFEGRSDGVVDRTVKPQNPYGGSQILSLRPEVTPVDSMEFIREDTADETPVDSVSEAIQPPYKNRDIPERDNRYLAALSPNKSASGNFSFSVYSSGGPGAVSRQSFPESVAVGSIGSDYVDWADNPMLGILLFNQGKSTRREVKHRLPVRVGFSFAYNINDRWGLESGVTYTNLTSDIKEGGESNYLEGEQRLHYIGIPINLKYRIMSWRKLDLYASAGVLAEKCISAKLTKEFVIDNRGKSIETESMPDKPMQWSLNSAIGVQYTVFHSMGVFVEPGISYYFDDGTPVQTIYKDKPLNFNLNLGIRITFEK